MDDTSRQATKPWDVHQESPSEREYIEVMRLAARVLRIALIAKGVASALIGGRALRRVEGLPRPSRGLDLKVTRATAGAEAAVIAAVNAMDGGTAREADDENGSKVNAAFASNLDDVIERYRPALWIHGPLHDRVDERIGATRIIANPHGFSLTEGADFEPDLIATV